MAVTHTCRKLRIAVLICHTTTEPIASDRGQFDSIFAAWLQTAAELRNTKNSTNEQVSLDVTGWDVVGRGQYPLSLSDIDGVIITGSTASAYDDEPWIHQLAAFIKDVYINYPSVKIFGGCFGHQIISHALLSEHGVQVQKNPNGWEVGVHQVHVSPGFAAEFPGILDESKLSLQFLHADHVTHGTKLPKGWLQMGTSNLCQVQGWIKPGRVLTYQGHPEFDKFINKWSVVSLGQSGKISKETLDEWLAMVDKDDHRIVAGEMALEFFLST